MSHAEEVQKKIAAQTAPTPPGTPPDVVPMNPEVEFHKIATPAIIQITNLLQSAPYAVAAPILQIIAVNTTPILDEDEGGGDG